MYAVKAIYDGANFIPTQPVDVEGQYEVVITFIEPISAPVKKNPRLLLEPILGKPISIGEFEAQERTQSSPAGELSLLCKSLLRAAPGP